uniref:Protein kinase, ABC1 family n=1 Tax=uncultured bacterium Contig12 TaxID=1393397 RepID=W0FPH5_9BACT|nr:protein kinase, ABC1 family [uncultured bacterium Contig12]
MSNFVTALLKQRKDAKKAEPNTNGRLKEILGVLNKYNYDNGITPEIIVNILQDLGPTFVKIGQIASQQTEYLPREYCDALAKLRSSVAPMEPDTVNAQIEKYLGKPVDELFASFSEKPLGSASIAQVHQAELFDGTIVAVKVRRPGIVDTVARDFALIEKILDKFIRGPVGGIDIKGFIVELEKTSKTELDLTNEANNLDRFWSNNAGREKVESPKCYRNLTCEAVLTESFVTGREVSDTEFLATLSDVERERLAALVADNFAAQVLMDGFYHADPHSGNVLIREPVSGEAAAETEGKAAGPADQSTEESGEGKEDADAAEKIPLPEHGIEWIDFGMMGTLSTKQRQLLIDIVTNVVMHDAYGLKRTVLQIAQPKGEINHGAMLEMCEGMCGQFTGSDFGDFRLGDLMDSILGGLQEENYDVDPFLTNLARGIIAMEGTVQTLSPKVNILNAFMAKVDIGFDLDLSNLDDEKLKEMNPEIALKLLQLAKGITDSSTKTAEALDMLEKGQIKVRTDFAFEEKALAAVTRISEYAIRALIIIALIIGSCVLCTSSSFMGDNVAAVTIIFRAIGLIGFFISLFFAQRLYRDMKKGK